jgi:hypothetical protein
MVVRAAALAGVDAARPALVVRSMVVRAAALAGVWAVASCGGPAVEVTEATPARLSARGGEALTLRGAGFTAGVEVHLGDEAVPASAVKLVSATELRVTTPPLYAGKAAVTVTTAAGDEATLPGGVAVLPLDLRFTEAPAYAFPVPTDPTVAGAALGDFDGDGDVDLITCVAGAPCALLQNDGRGHFVASPGSKSAPRFPAGMPDTRAVVAADLDGDGALDLVLGTGAGGLLLRNDGKARFSAAGVHALPADTDAVTAVAVGDLDGDGRPDLVFANDTPDAVPFRVYRNATKGTDLRFTAAPAGTVPAADWIVAALALVDVDGDGDLDLVLSTPGAADGVTLRVLLQGEGGFHEAPGLLPNVPGGAFTAFAAGDVDGDGAVDLVAVGPGQDRLFLNDGSGHFFDATLASMPLDASAGTAVALVDLDRDRHLDLVIGNAGAETRLYLNDGTGRFFDHTPVLPLRADPTVWVGVADVDGDADQDLLVLNASPDPAHLYLSVEPTSP